MSQWNITDSSCISWEMGTGSELSTQDCLRINVPPYEVTNYVAVCENFVKIIHRWYLVLAKIKRLLPNADDCCFVRGVLRLRQILTVFGGYAKCDLCHFGKRSIKP